MTHLLVDLLRVIPSPSPSASPAPAVHAGWTNPAITFAKAVGFGALIGLLGLALQALLRPQSFSFDTRKELLRSLGTGDWLKAVGGLRAFSIALLGATPVISIGVARLHGPAVVVLVGLQVVVAITAYLVAEARTGRVADERLAAAAEVRVQLADSLDPILASLADMADTPLAERPTALTGVVMSVLASASELPRVGARGRASYYRISSDGQRMDRVATVGRVGRSKTTFSRGSEPGASAIAMVLAGRHLFVENVALGTPPGWEATEHGAYSTFASVPVISGSRAHGMLTLDAVEAGAISVEDVDLLLAFSHILGAAEGMAN